jgi:hypothetical protein
MGLFLHSHGLKPKRYQGPHNSGSPPKKAPVGVGSNNNPSEYHFLQESVPWKKESLHFLKKKKRKRKRKKLIDWIGLDWSLLVPVLRQDIKFRGKTAAEALDSYYGICFPCSPWIL